MNSNSPKNNSKNKAKSIGMLTAIAGSCLLSTVLIQTSASAFIPNLSKFSKPLAQATKVVVNNPNFLSGLRRTDFKNLHQNSKSHVSNLKSILTNKVITTPSARPPITTGAKTGVTQLVKTFSNTPTLTLKK